MSAYLDTHVALWLYAGETGRISKRAATLINRESMLVSPIVLLELEYLREVGRVAATPQTVIAELKRRVGLAIQNRSLEAVAEQALDLDWTRDVFDRLDRKSTRLNSSHSQISYAVFCLKKKKK